MNELARSTWALYLRSLRENRRLPVLMLPGLSVAAFMILIGQYIWQGVANIPGFPAEDYLSFEAPTMVVWAVMFGGAFSALSLVSEINSGFLDKLLVTPAPRASIIFARMVGDWTRFALQSVLVLILAVAVGAPLESGLGGAALIVIIGATFGVAYAGIFQSLAIAAPNEQVIQAAFPIFIPILFMSSALMPIDTYPAWLEQVSNLNPMTTIIDGLRTLMLEGYDWRAVWEASVTVAVIGIVTTGATLILMARRVRLLGG